MSSCPEKCLILVSPDSSAVANGMPSPIQKLRGHWIRVQPSGTKSFWTVARDPKQKQGWTYGGPCDAMTIEEARAKARGILNRVRAGQPAIERKGETFDAVIADWRKRYVEDRKLRTG